MNDRGKDGSFDDDDDDIRCEKNNKIKERKKQKKRNKRKTWHEIIITIERHRKEMHRED